MKVVPAEAEERGGEVRAVTPIMKYFAYQHLPAHLQVVSAKVHELANYMDKILPNGPEKTTGLRKLLEAKDCFVRAYLDTLPPKPTSIPAVEDNKFQNRN